MDIFHSPVSVLAAMANRHSELKEKTEKRKDALGAGAGSTFFPNCSADHGGTGKALQPHDCPTPVGAVQDRNSTPRKIMNI